MKLWHKLSQFFEKGDLTPLAVIVSIAHYGPVLVSHGEHVFIAYVIGTLVDMLHFRSVRRMVSPMRNRLDIAIGVLTMVMASMYHFRYYGNDLLLALPIPLGIGILAYHAAQDDNRVNLRQEYDNACRERDTLRHELVTARQELAQATEWRDKMPALAMFVDISATGKKPNGEITEVHGIGQSTVDRTFRAFGPNGVTHAP